MGIISNFNPLRGRFPLLLSSACLRHYALLLIQIELLPRNISYSYIIICNAPLETPNALTVTEHLIKSDSNNSTAQ